MAGTLTVRIVGDDSHFQKTVGSVGSGLGKIGGLALKAGALLGGAGLAGGLAAAVSEAREAAKIGRLTEQVIKTTGGVAKITADQVGDLAESLSNLTGVDDEAIQGASNLLLTFTKVKNEVGKGNDIFSQATTAALDMSVALGSDVNGAAMLMGKALNDPIKGMTALTRSGVSFTQQQKDQVKAMVESGNVLGAQKVILGEMQTQFGGAAAAAADPLQKLQTIAGNLLESLGTQMLPVIEKAATWLGAHLPAAMTRASAAIDTVIGAVQRLWPTVEQVFGSVRSVVETAVGFVSGLLDRFRSDHDNAATGIGEASSRIGQILGSLREMFSSAFEAIRAIVDTAVKVIREMWDRFGKGLIDNLQNSVRAILTTVEGMLTVLSGVFDLIKAVLTGKWGEAWDAIKKIASGVVQALGGIVRLGLEQVRIAVETVMGVVSGAWSAVWNGFKTVASDVLNKVAGFMRELPGKLVSAVAGIGNTMFGIGLRIIEGLVNAVKQGAGSVLGAFKDAVMGPVDTVKGWLGIKSPSRVFMKIGQYTIEGFINGVKGKKTNVVQAMRDVFGDLSSQVSTMLGGFGVMDGRAGAQRRVSDAKGTVNELIAEKAGLPKAIAAAERELIAARVAGADAEVIVELEEKLEELRTRQKTINNDLRDAEEELTEAKFAAIAAEHAYLEQQEKLLDVGPKAIELFKQLAAAAGLNREEIEKLVGAYGRLSGGAGGVTVPGLTGGTGSFLNSKTGRTAVTGPNGEAGILNGDPRVKALMDAGVGLQHWTNPHTNAVTWFAPGQSIDKGNVDALKSAPTYVLNVNQMSNPVEGFRHLEFLSGR